MAVDAFAPSCVSTIIQRRCSGVNQAVVAGVRADQKVLGSIVFAIPVDVMNYCAGGKPLAKCALSNCYVDQLEKGAPKVSVLVLAGHFLYLHVAKAAQYFSWHIMLFGLP
ncbi:MAG: hypothetical protein XXXNARYT_003413 [Candidatus Accumulibacter regalis]